MHSDLLERGRALRDLIEAPAFPLAAIRAAAARPAARAPRRRTFVAVVLAGFSIAAIAAAAEVVQRAHLVFVPSGGMIVSSATKLSSREIHTDADIREAAKHLDFQAVLPAGLPDGAQPIKLDMAGTSLLTITYALPVSQDGSRHKVWIFLANPLVTSPSGVPLARYHARNGYPSEVWRVGQEQVIVVSDGMAKPGFAAIKDAMERASP
jgi:hypothetical protein